MEPTLKAPELSVEDRREQGLDASDVGTLFPSPVEGVLKGRASIGNRLLRFLENGLTLTLLGIMGGLAGTFLDGRYFVILTALVPVAIHRSKSLEGLGQWPTTIVYFFSVSTMALLLFWCGVSLNQSRPTTFTPQDYANAVKSVILSLTSQKTNEHPPAEAKSQNRTETRDVDRRYLALTFKESPLFTPRRKKVISNEMNSFYLYLIGLGIKAPNDVPPIAVLNGRGFGVGGKWDTPRNSRLLTLAFGKDDLDKPWVFVAGYSSYAFEVVLDYPSRSTPSDERDNRLLVTQLYAEYFA